MRIKWILTVAAALCCRAGSAGEDVRDAFAAMLRRRSAETETIACRFVQVRSSAALAAPVQKEGAFRYRRPSDMALLFDDGDRIVMSADRLAVVSGGRKNVMKMESNPGLRLMKRVLAACLTGDVETLAAGGDFRCEESPQEWIVTVEARKGRASKSLARVLLRFDKRDMTLEGLRLEESSGDYTEYVFRDKKLNVPVDDDAFTM